MKNAVLQFFVFSSEVRSWQNVGSASTHGGKAGGIGGDGGNAGGIGGGGKGGGIGGGYGGDAGDQRSSADETHKTRGPGRDMAAGRWRSAARRRRPADGRR